MPDRWLIIDGNNLLHHHAELTRLAGSDFEQARQRLVQMLDEVGGELGYERVTVVFDGRGAKVQPATLSPHVQVLFSPAHLTADSIIERLVQDAPERDRLLIVSSDRCERDTVEAAGGSTMSCSNFLDLLEERRRQVTQKVRNSRHPSSGGKLGDFMP